MRVVPVEEQPAASGVVVGVVTEQPAPASGVVVGVVTAQPGASSGGAARGVVDQTLAMLDGLADEGGRGSLESLGRWNEKRDDRAMPIKLEAEDPSRDKCKAERNRETMVRVALGRLVDELVRTNASSGILAISYFSEIRGTDNNRRRVTVWGFSWSASPDDTSYQRHGSVAGTASTKYGRYGVYGRRGGGDQTMHENIRFADFEGVVDDIVQDRAWDQIAVYRVTLPSRGLDPWKWAGRPPPPAPEELYTGPRRDGLLSTDEISGDYFAPCLAPFCFCNSMTVVPLGADTIETWRTGCVFFPPCIGPVAEGAVRTRNPGTNAFLNSQNPPFNPDPNSNLMTFSADGTANGCYKKRRTSQKRAFHKVETRDLAGKWCGIGFNPFVALWPFTSFLCTKKKALNQDQYEESGLIWILGLPGCMCGTRTRIYVNGHPTNGFAGAFLNDSDPDLVDHWHRDPGCAASDCFFAKKAG
ncbi:unnamed protein product [Pelagomonas calceolata]|uniref:Uncharacterized protein n=1 Tax=Pelagomonas calceolata TaxID=35677 RepID=A0A8J2WXA5_9STRA|nr:unnamed protein product [Pelagomonas calceolata]